MGALLPCGSDVLSWTGSAKDGIRKIMGFEGFFGHFMISPRNWTFRFEVVGGVGGISCTRYTFLISRSFRSQKVTAHITINTITFLITAIKCSSEFVQ